MCDLSTCVSWVRESKNALIPPSLCDQGTVTDLKTDNLEQISNAIVEVHTLRVLFFDKMHGYLAVMTEENLERVGWLSPCSPSRTVPAQCHCVPMHWQAWCTRACTATGFLALVNSASHCS